MTASREGDRLRMLPDVGHPWQRCGEWSEECVEKENTDILSMSGVDGRVRRDILG